VSSLELTNISKRFGAVSVFEHLSLTVGAGEFVAFLGPSGCGKSTLLRIIAGLDQPDSGEVRLGDRRIDALAPGARGVAMVFQHYALYPHMTARENIAFGLHNARLPKAEIDQRVAEAARILEIDPLLDKKPGTLSGGERQRVAIGRAIVKKPQLFLFDEPLANLDAALRTRTRLELAQLRRRVEATMIMVTHDQVEAMTLADRVVVMDRGRIQQVGPPMEIYARPANTFVAGFVGSPRMTMVPVVLETGQGPFATVRLGDGSKLATRVPAAGLAKEGLLLGLRPENVRLAPPADGATTGTIEFVERLGDRTLVYVKLADGASVTAEDAGDSRARVGEAVSLVIQGAAAHLFGPDGVRCPAAGEPG
jgi:multiple sugar transport system ATP-binding protein